MAKYIVPIFILSILLIALVKKVPLYDSFAVGIREALKLVFNIFPYIAAIFICMELLTISGLSEMLSSWMAPVFRVFGIPPELSKLMILRPLSGNGSIAILSEIYMLNGVDSYIGRCASVIVGCSETIFYISALYFSTTSIKKLRYAIPVALISMIVGAIVGCLICKVL